MGEEAIYSFFELAKTQRTSEQIQKDAEQSIRIVSNMITEKEVLEEPLPFHWVIVTDRVQAWDRKILVNLALLHSKIRWFTFLELNQVFSFFGFFAIPNNFPNLRLSKTFGPDKRVQH